MYSLPVGKIFVQNLLQTSNSRTHNNVFMKGFRASIRLGSTEGQLYNKRMSCI